MKSLIMLMLLAVMPAKAQLTGCQYTSGGLTLSKVRSTASGTQIFGCINDTFDRLSSSAAYVSSTSRPTFGQIYVDTITARGGRVYFSSPTVAGSSMTASQFYGPLAGNATTATALAANGGNCSANSYPLGVDASGAAESCGTTISGNAGTATALAANGANCSAGNYPLGVDASGAVESCTSIAASLNGHTIATGTLTAGSTGFPAAAMLTFDKVYFTGVSSPTQNATFISLNTSSSALPSTRQVFLTGSGTYTTPAGAAQIIVRMVGGGGGGAADNTSNGAGGPATVFGSTSAYGGGSGVTNNGAPGAGGTGGSSSANVVRVPGAFGDNSYIYANSNGVAAPANSGLGGGGGVFGSGTRIGSAGGNGEYVEIRINGPAASYSYSVSSGGIGAVLAGDYDGANGGSGYIIVDEFYPAIGPTGATGATGASGANGANGVSFNGGWTATAPSGDVYLTTSTNNIGIGNSAPESKVHVNIGSGVSTITVGNASNGSGSIMVYANSGVTNGITIGPSVDLGARLRYNSNGNLDITPRDGFNTTLNRLGGRVSIGITNPCSTCTLHVAGTVVSRGVTDASEVGGGFVGEYISSSIATGFNFPGSDTFFDCGAITLTAGDWDVSLTAYISGSGVTGTLLIAGIGDTTGNSSSNVVYGDTAIRTTTIATSQTLHVSGVRRISSSTTTAFCKAYATYAVGTPAITATRISARRVR